MNTPSTICERLAEALRGTCALLDELYINTPNAVGSERYYKATVPADEVLAEYAALPPPSPVARDGWVMVPREVMDLYQFMKLSFVPFTSQHEQIAISLRKATDALAAAPTPPQAQVGEEKGEVVAPTHCRECKCALMLLCPQCEETPGYMTDFAVEKKPILQARHWKQASSECIEALLAGRTIESKQPFNGYDDWIEQRAVELASLPTPATGGGA